MANLSGLNIVQNTQAEKIILFSISLFQKEGIRKVTTEEIAKKLSISKKTLYNIFPSKSDLIFQCVQYQLLDAKSNMESLAESNMDAIEEMMYIAQRVISIYKEFNDDFVYELEKFYPKSWTLIKQYKITFVKKIISENLTKGKEQGFYRIEINEKIVSSIYIAASNSLLDYDIFSPKERLANIFKEFFLYHIHAVATEEGIKRLNELSLKIQL